MARIPYFDTATATGRAADVYAKLPPLNIFRMMGHGGDLVHGFVGLCNALLSHSQLDPVLREIAILRVGALSGAAYEVQQHEAIGRRLGMNEALLAGIREGAEAGVFDEAQREVMRFTDDVVANVRAGDASFEPLRARLSLQEL